jgi:putative ABC transport system ATP-binding protein
MATVTSGTDAASVEGVVKRYREGDTDHVVLDGASARIAHGEFVALIGPSGSGKSTLLNLLGGIDLPDAGRVMVAGHDLGALDETARTLFRRRSIGFVFQFLNLIPTLTVFENLLLPLELNGITAGEERARDMLVRVGLEARAATYPDRLSGGEQQRIAIARAIVHEPSLVLADEPTGNLDDDTGERVLDLLGEIAAAGTRSLVVVTHSESLAARADRVLRLHHGRLEEVSKR